VLDICAVVVTPLYISSCRLYGKREVLKREQSCVNRLMSSHAPFRWLPGGSKQLPKGMTPVGCSHLPDHQALMAQRQSDDN